MILSLLFAPKKLAAGDPTTGLVGSEMRAFHLGEQLVLHCSGGGIGVGNFLLLFKVENDKRGEGRVQYGAYLVGAAVDQYEHGFILPARACRTASRIWSASSSAGRFKCSGS